MSADKSLVLGLEKLKALEILKGRSGLIDLDGSLAAELESCVVWLPRNVAETRSDIMHFASYVLVISASSNGILSYKRPDKIGEKALLGARSVGFGGHPSWHDIQHHSSEREGMDLMGTLQATANRELNEELKFIVGQEEVKMIPTINTLLIDWTNPVGMRHVAAAGCVYIDVDDITEILPRADDNGKIEIEDLRWIKKTEDQTPYESWSKVILSA